MFITNLLFTMMLKIAMETNPTASTNADQIAYWNGPQGKSWLARQQSQDAILAPIAKALYERAALRAGEHVIDVGCGCGDTSIELARRVAPGGHVVGIDISAPMLDRARQRIPAGASVEFTLADATVHPFAPARADLLFSRFGVMFFEDPLRSFKNLRTALRPGGRVAFACWREPKRNGWLMAPLQEAYKHVPKMPEMAPDAPGPFAFRSEDRVRGILEGAGFASVEFEAIDLTLDIANGQGIDAALDTATGVGPASRAMEGQPTELRAAARAAIRAMLVERQVGDTVPFAASIWVVRAVNPKA